MQQQQQTKADTQPTPPSLGLRRVQSLSIIEQVQIARGKAERLHQAALPTPATPSKQRLARNNQRGSTCARELCCHTPTEQHKVSNTTATPEFGAVVTHASIATPEFGAAQVHMSSGQTADPLAWLEHESTTKADMELMLHQALQPVLARLDAQESLNQGLRRALEATIKRATDSEATCRRLEERLNSFESTCTEASERSFKAIDKVAAVELMTAQELQQLQEVSNTLMGKCEEADRASSEASAARADLRAAELGFGEAVEECKAVMAGLKGQVRDQLARKAEKGEAEAAAASATSAADAAASANARVGQVEGTLLAMQRKMHDLETTIIAVEQSIHEPHPSTSTTRAMTGPCAAGPVDADLGTKQRALQLEEKMAKISGKVQDIEAELRRVTAVANLQEVVATQLVRDAHDTMQASRGRNMVIFDPPPAPVGYDRLPADRKAAARKDQAISLCVQVQSAYEKEEKGRAPDRDAIKRYYDLAIASTSEFYTRPSKTAIPGLVQATQRNLVVSFTSQQGKIGFLSMNGALHKSNVIATKQKGGDATGRDMPRSSQGAALRATHDLTVAERTAKQALTVTMMELRTSGKRTAVGAHRGQAVLFVFQAGAAKQRDVYVWDSIEGKPACMLRGIGEDDWKQFVRTERPFPSSPCGYLGYDQRPHRQRGFSDKPTYVAILGTMRGPNGSEALAIGPPLQASERSNGAQGNAKELPAPVRSRVEQAGKGSRARGSREARALCPHGLW